MAAGSKSSRYRIWHDRTNCPRYSKKANQLNGLAVERRIPSACLVLLLLLVLISLTTFAQTPDSSRRTRVHGLIVTTQGEPVARATVEVRDLHGVKMATGFTDNAGSFAITAAAQPGDYVLLVSKELRIGDERISLDQPDREVRIALPVEFGSSAGRLWQMYTVSAQKMRVPARARAHLKLAQEKFSKSNFAGTQREIDRALQVDPNCAPAFSMRGSAATGFQRFRRGYRRCHARCDP